MTEGNLFDFSGKEEKKPKKKILPKDLKNYKWEVEGLKVLPRKPNRSSTTAKDTSCRD